MQRYHASEQTHSFRFVVAASLSSIVGAPCSSEMLRKKFGGDMEKVNANGGAIALGHPLGASGTKLMATLLNELERTDGKYGLQVMCEGGGMANATLIERI